MKIKNIILAVLITAWVCAHAYTPGGHYERAMWVWDFYTSASTPEQRRELLSFCEEHGVDLLFVGTEAALTSHPSDYAQLIMEADEMNIRVFALAGSPTWALREHHDEALRHLHDVLDYNTKYPQASFDGIQLDIEPYTLPEFFDDSERISEEMLELLEETMNILGESDEPMELNAAIPFWYATGQSAVQTYFASDHKALSHHILDIVDSVSIMAYRNNAEAQIQTAQADLDYAAKAGKKAYVGAETKPPEGDSIPWFVTYYEESIDTMHKHLRKIERHFARHPAFAGIAVHTYDSYKEMVERE